MNEKVADLWRKFKAIFCRKYDNNKFWNIRHALETPEKLNPLVRAVYILYYEKENRRSNADIAIGFDEKMEKLEKTLHHPRILQTTVSMELWSSLGNTGHIEGSDALSGMKYMN